MEFLTLYEKLVGSRPNLRHRHGNLRPYCSKILGCDSSVVETVHFEKHFVSLPEKAAHPEWLIAISTHD